MRIRPNILLIVMDATRAQSLSCYGYRRPTTPSLERFAELCTVYETAISTSGWSLPAHASLFTGVYPSKHGAHEQHKYLAAESPTIAEILRSQGYHTLAFCHNQYVRPATGVGRGFVEFNPVAGRIPRSLAKIARKAATGIAMLLGTCDSGARRTNRQVFAALRRAQAEERPFFMFVNYGEPHAPYSPPRRYNRYLPDGVSLDRARRVNQDAWRYLADAVSMDERDFEILTALYDAEITYLDARLGEVLGRLAESNILDQTMVVITADHGENIGDHRLMAHKYCLYDTLVHVPLMIHYPESITEPCRVTYQVQTVDLVPTILALLGETSSEAYRSLQGHDLLSSSRHQFTIAEWARPDLSPFYRAFPGADISRFDRSLKMIRTDRHKYIWGSDGVHELYDLRADPDETRNLIAQHPAVATDLDRQLKDWHLRHRGTTPSGRAPEPDRTVKERLRALGYLE